MKKNILVPTDFSDNAWSALVYAFKLFCDEACTFHLLHSTKITASTMSVMSNKLLNVISSNALKDLKDIQNMAEASNANANHNFEIILSSADLNQSIENAIVKYNIDLIVMGTKGATGAKELFFGSHTVKIIKDIKSSPILIVPDEFDFVVPQRIAFPTDYTRFYSEKELRPLKDLAELYDSKIMPVCILTKEKLTDIQEYNMTKLENYLDNYTTSFHFMPKYAKKATEINDFIQQLEVNILVMVNYKHSFIEGLVKEPIIKKIGFHPLIPFLVIPE